MMFRSRRRAPRFLAVAVALLAVAVPGSLQAQMSGVQTTGRFGIANPSDAYQSNCGAGSLAFSVDVQGQGQWFPQVSADHFVGSGGGGVACIPGDPSRVRVTGGLQLERSTRLSIGAGRRVGNDGVQLEGVVLGGIITGQRGYQGTTPNDERLILPQFGGQVGVVLVRYVVLSGSVHWTRLTMDTQPLTGGAPTKRAGWSPLSTMQIGVRIPFGRR
ncbi:hypothetical protein [Gemmatimonas aurantiaca]|nr:hypothetical protein [Gemmatimonas aurantiaca]